MSDLPHNWQVKSFGEVAEFINGRAFKSAELGDKGLQIIRSEKSNGIY